MDDRCYGFCVCTANTKKTKLPQATQNRREKKKKDETKQKQNTEKLSPNTRMAFIWRRANMQVHVFVAFDHATMKTIDVVVSSMLWPCSYRHFRCCYVNTHGNRIHKHKGCLASPTTLRYRMLAVGITLCFVIINLHK